MSGFEHTDTDNASAQFTETSKSNVMSTNSQICLSEKREFSYTENGPSLFFESSTGFQHSLVGETGTYNDNVANWDAESLNSMGNVFHMLDADVQGFGPSGMGNNTLNDIVGATPLDKGTDRGDVPGERVSVGDAGGFNNKPVGGIEEMQGKVEAAKEVTSADGSENFCDTVSVGSGSPDNCEKTSGKGLSARKFENQTIEGIEVSTQAWVCDVAKQWEENACLNPVTGEHSLSNDLMIYEGGVSKNPHSDKVAGEKQDFGFQGILSKPPGDEVLQQLLSDSIADPVLASSKNDHEMLDDLVNSSMDVSNVEAAGNNTLNDNAGAAHPDKDADRGDIAGKHVPVDDGDSYNSKPVEDASKEVTTGIEEMPGKVEAAKEVTATDGSENFCDTVGACIGSGKGLNDRKFENQTIEGTEADNPASICDVAKQSEENACLKLVTGEHSLSNGSMKNPQSDKISGEKQDFGSQGSPSKPPREEVLQQLQSDSTADPVRASSKNDHEIPDDLVNSSMDVSNVVAEGTSPHKMTDIVGFEQGLGNIGEVNLSGILAEIHEQVGKAASEDEQDSAGEPKSQDDIGKGVDGVEGDRSAASDEKLGPVELSRALTEEEGPKAYVMVLGLPIYDASEKTYRGRRPVETPATTGKKAERTSARTVKTPASASAATGKRSGRSSDRIVKTPESTSTAAGVMAEKSSTTPGKRRGRPSGGSARVLRSKEQDKPVTLEPSTIVENAKSSSARRRGRKRKSELEGKSNDEFSRMRAHLRYLLHRIGKERNFLEAYSSEGWRGQSLEKLRPEKELERAKKDINRFKLKIRELFHRIDSMSAEGKFPDSLYDSDGLIDSEDIYCARCGSKDLSTGNDILLCDGVCDRGFHQYCLEPPLRSEEIPPGDEGWLCPTCDCKVDCIDLLNDSQGTNLEIEDSWEKVFPEATATMTGHEQGDMSGFPSDDSEDNDYNPDGPDDNPKVEGGDDSSDGSDSESDSDSSDFSSASEDLEAVCGDKKILDLPSDDSEDNDYDPNGANVNEEKGSSSSSSDFTSNSEDLGATLGDDGTSDKGEPPAPCDLDENIGDSLPLSGKRHVERLDYKKLYDETYGNADEDSSDDEEWKAGMTGTRKKRNGAHTWASADVTDSVVTPQRKGRSRLNKPAANGSPAEMESCPQESSSASKSRKRPPYNKIGETATQRLHESFKENQFPDRLTKENLAKELGLTPLKVDKWFGNARWSLRHHPTRMEARIAKVVPDKSSVLTVASSGAGTSTDVGSLLSGNADTSKLNIERSSKRSSTRQKSSNKRKKIDTNEPMLQTCNTENSESRTPVKRDLSGGNTTAALQQSPESQLRRSQRKRKSVD